MFQIIASVFMICKFNENILHFKKKDWKIWLSMALIFYFFKFIMKKSNETDEKIPLNWDISDDITMKYTK